MHPSVLRLGTRGSQLALYQAHYVQRLLAESGGFACEIVIIKTSGDRLQERPLSEEGGKRLFVKEIEDALLCGDIDLAVHSSKDMPADMPAGLTIAGVLPREDPHDAVVLPRRPQGPGLGAIDPESIGDIPALVAALGQTPTIATSSVRRVAQLTRLFPAARFVPIRGNLDTRLRKLDEGQIADGMTHPHDALVLAAAGLKRLGFESRISLRLPVTVCVPSPGQGIIAIEVRKDDARVSKAVAAVTDRHAAAALEAERAVVEALGGGCQTPIGALATVVHGHSLDLVATVIALDGSRAVRAGAQGPMVNATALGEHVAADLLAAGAGEILEEARRVQTRADRSAPTPASQH